MNEIYEYFLKHSLDYLKEHSYVLHQWSLSLTAMGIVQYIDYKRCRRMLWGTKVTLLSHDTRNKSH